MGLLNRNEADLGIGNLFLTLLRAGAVDYSAPYDAEVGGEWGGGGLTLTHVMHVNARSNNPQKLECATSIGSGLLFAI